jgi:hypothetical protein
MEYPGTVRTEGRKPRRQDWMVAIVEKVLPGPHAERTARDLRIHHPDALSYLYHSAGKILCGIAEGIVKAFDFQKVFGEAFALFFIAFAGAPLQPKIAVTVMALIVLRVRDAYGYYLLGSAGDAATDSLVMAAIVALSQVYLLRAYPPAVMPALPMVQGIALGMLLVAFWRLYCQLQTPFHNPQKRPEFRIFSSTLRITFMFFVACAASLMAGTKAVPDTGHVRDGLLGVLVPGTIFVMMVLKKNVIGSLLWGKVTQGTIFTDPDQEESELKRSALVAMRFRALAFTLLAAPVGIAVWRWGTGSPDPVLWPLVAMNFVSCIALLFLWTKIRQLNLKAVTAMRAARAVE